MKRPIGLAALTVLEIPHAVPMSAAERATRGLQRTRALLDELELRGRQALGGFMPRQSGPGPALRALAVLSLLSLAAAGVARADVKESSPGQWSGGAGVGFLANTPDGAEFGLFGHADYFLTQRLSIGPSVQYAGVGNDILVGVSVQAKYWWNILASRNVKLVVQGGIGVVRAAIEDADSGVSGTYTSFLIPLGVGLDYAVTTRVAVTVDILVNFTSLGEHVPSLAGGVKSTSRRMSCRDCSWECASEAGMGARREVVRREGDTRLVVTRPMPSP